MSREPGRKGYFNRDPRNRDRDRDRERGRDRDREDGPRWEPPEYRSRRSDPLPRKSRSPLRDDKRRSRSPRKNKDVLDENILSEISKLPEPSELWDNQFQDGTYPAPPPPGFQPEGIPNPTYGSTYQPSYSGIYDDFPPVASMPAVPLPPEISAWNQMSLPPPPSSAPPAPFITNPEDQMKKEAAIESEMRHQKAALSKQREDYMKKAGILKKELDTLKDQRNELRGDAKRSPSPDTKRFLKENTKLQLEIQNKLKTINNVVDMLNGIIGEEAQEIVDDDETGDKASKRKSRSPSAGHKCNYVYYDPEMHWCRVCNEFPPTAKDYLNHLHSPAHHKMAAAHMEAPWHTVSGVNEGFPSFPSAPTKRTPIRGLQFFVPSTAWYCKLCDQFIGDLHCASAHLKSITHSKNYTNFVEQNPHWETDWMSDRQKAFEKARNSKGKIEEKQKPQQYMSHTITFNKDGFHTKRKDSPTPTAEDKKKKKERKKKNKRKSSSSSSSSNSSSSDSEPVKKKKKKKVKREPDDKTLTEWMTALQTDRLNDNDRKLLDSIKNRIKNEKTEDEKRRSPERSSADRDRSESKQRKNRESERRESRSRDIRDRRDGRDDRDRRRDDRRDDRRDERRDDRRDDRRASPPRETKKPEIRKMPFIGKMPVYKSLGKSKTEEVKKEESKKKDDDEASKKRREEMDAEIQKKVAEFKEKIAKAQLERQQQELPPPAVALPTALGVAPPLMTIPTPVPPAPTPAPVPVAQPPAQKPPNTLQKDFQDALDIIFPKDVKPDMSQPDLFSMAGIPPGFPMGLGGVMPPFPPFLQPQMPPQMPPQMMMGFDINNSLFQPRAQLYDTHVPLVPSPKQRQNKNMNRNQNKNNQINKNAQNNKNKTLNQKKVEPAKKDNAASDAANSAAKKQEEMDDLAMLGIDASDVGAGI